MDNGTCELLLLLASFLTSKAPPSCCWVGVGLFFSRWAATSPDQWGEGEASFLSRRRADTWNHGGPRLHFLHRSAGESCCFSQLWKTSVLRSSQVVVVMIRKAFLITNVIRCQHKNMFEVIGMRGLCSIVITLLEPEKHKSPPPSGFTDGHHWTMSIRPASARPDGTSAIPMIRDGPDPAPALRPSFHTRKGCQY